MPAPKKTIAGGSILAIMLALASPAIKKYEGYSVAPYYDQVHKLTVCYGETHVKMHKYSRAECNSMLDGRLAEFGQGVLKRNPTLATHPYQWAAATSLSYNIGLPAYSRSTVAKNFDAGKWSAACDSFLSWSYAGGKFNQGLRNRRVDERRLCLQQLP